MGPSRSDAGRDVQLTVRDNRPIASCVSMRGLNNGIMPRECRLLRDFFCFTNDNADGGKIVMDLGTTQPVSMINTYSAHGPVGGTTWCEEFDGSRGPQVYSVYGSAKESPDFDHLNSADWEHIADVDTRPSADSSWVGQYGVNISGENGAVMGAYRWIVWQVRPTLKPGADNPNWTDTWYAEFDVHTPQTAPQGGDFIFTGNQIDEIIVVYKTHFDIGFTHPAPEIVNTYRTEMIDNALKVIDESDDWPAEKRFSWTIPSWVAYQILWDGQDSTRRARVLKAVRDGRLVVHGLPVTVHTESLDLEDVVFALSFNRIISQKLGIPMSRSGKMTDVPSHSWIWPTVLKNAGIDFLHIGVNPVNERPDLPILYKWEGPDGSQLLTMHSQGYGSDVEFGHGIYPPVDWPYRHWLGMIVSTDNAGPPKTQEVEWLLGELSRDMPGVHVRFGKMEDFADAILEEERQGARIPVVRQDMPDCWIHGVGTMPVMDSLAHATRPRIAAAKMLDAHLRMWGVGGSPIDSGLFVAQERSLMYGEHTWGGSRNLEGMDAYHISDFGRFVQTDDRCRWLTSTWNDHADYMRRSAHVTDSLIRLETDRLTRAVSAREGSLLVYNPLPRERDMLVEVPGSNGQRFLAKGVPASGYRCYPMPPTQRVEADKRQQAVVETRFFRIEFDRERGGIVSILNKSNGKEMVDTQAPHAFGTYLYERFDSVQMLDYHLGCSHLNTVYGYNGRGCRGWNVRKDLPGTPSSQSAAAQYDSMEVRKVAEGTEVVLTARPKGIIRATVRTTVFVPDRLPWIEVGVALIDKEPDYWPESGSIYLPVNAQKPKFRLGRLGSVVDPATDFARGSNRTYGCLNDGAMIVGADGTGVGIYPRDNALVSFGEQGLGTIDPDYVPRTPLAKVNMFNTIWTINFPYWIQETLTSRVRIWGVDAPDEANLLVPALEAKSEGVVAVIPSGHGGEQTLPASLEGIRLSEDGFRITSMGPDAGGSGDLLRIWNMQGADREVTVYLPRKSRYTQAIPVNLRGERVGEPFPVVRNQWTFTARRNAPHSFVLQ